MARFLRRTAIAVGVAVLLLLVAMVLAPVLFKDQLLSVARTQIGRQLNAEVDFADASLSLLGSFPVFELSIESLRVVGGGEAFADTPLVEAKSVVAGVDVWSLVTAGQVIVTRLAVREPTVRLVVDRRGRANYDLGGGQEEAAPEPDPGAGTKLQLSDYEITGGNLSYSTPQLSVRIEGLEHRGRAAIEGAVQELTSTTKIASLSVVNGPTAYLKQVGVNLTIDTTVDAGNGALILRTFDLGLNELALAAQGEIGWSAGQTRLDLELGTREDASVKGLLSIIPNAYTDDFSSLIAGGRFSLRAEVSGALGPGEQDFPALRASLMLDEGRFQYPGRPLPVENLKLEAVVDHPGGALDRASIRVPAVSFKAGASAASGRLALRTVQSDPVVDLDLQGRLDLADLAKALPVEDDRAMTGRIQIDVSMAGSAGSVERLKGDVEAKNLRAEIAGVPPVEVRTASVRFDERATHLDELFVVAKNSDVKVKGTAAPLTVLMSNDAPLTARLEVRSKKLVVEDFTGDPKPGTEKTEDAEGASKETEEPPSEPLIPANVDARVKLQIDRLAYGDLAFSNVRGTAKVKDRTFRLDDFSANGFGGEMKAAGAVQTSTVSAPSFDFTYALSDAVFGDTFSAVGLVRTFAPIAKHLTGRFATELSIQGKLGPDLAIQPRLLDARGFVATVDSQLTDFKPLNAVAKTIPRIDAPLTLKSLKAQFTVQNGEVRVKDFPVDIGGLSLVVGGTHGIDQRMRYRVQLELPVDEVRGSPLSGRLAALTDRLGLLERVRVVANVTGTVEDPKTEFAVAGPDPARLAEEKLGEAKRKAAEKAAEAAKALLDEARGRAADIRAQALRAAKKVEAEGESKAQRLIDEAAGNPLKRFAAAQAADAVRKSSQRAARKLIEEADLRAERIVREAQAEANRMKTEELGRE